MTSEKFSIQLGLLAYGGVLPKTHDCIVRDVLQLASQTKLLYATLYNDADVGRVRGKLATNFLRHEQKPDVLIMVDHDMTWRPGDLYHLAKSAYETKGIVGGVVSLKAFGQGIATRFAVDGAYQTGIDKLEPATYVGSAFMAAHRCVFERIVEAGLQCNHDGWFPFFLQRQEKHPLYPGAMEHLSEDWAFCRRALELGLPVHVDLQPVIGHVGEHEYTIQDSQTALPLLHASYQQTNK